MIKRCPICGLKTKESSSFCPFDGQKLEPAVASAERAAAQTGPSMVSQARGRRAERMCPNCAAQYPARAKFCPRDGTRLETTGDVSLSDASSVINATEQESGQEQKWDPDSLIGHTIATHYKLVEKIGQGGMGVVYKAEHIRISRPAAIKILIPELAGDSEIVARFEREAEMASRINHPNAVGIYDVGEEGNGLVYIAMEYIDGQQLSKIIERESPLPSIRAANIIRQVAGALDAAHQLNIVHRDLKPDNIMICRRAGKLDWVKVVDFGIAKQVQHGFGYQALTRRGLILGTPEYMAPEQLLREPLDSRTDVYSLGLVAYKMLTGKLPFAGKNPREKMMKKLTEQPRGFKEARPDLSLPEEMEAIVMKAISREPNDRYSSALEFSASIERAAGGIPLYDPAVEPLLQSASAAAGAATPLRASEETEAESDHSEHQATIITFPQRWTESRSLSQTIPPTADALPAVRDTRSVTPSASEPSRSKWPDQSPEDDISAWQAAPAYSVAQTTYLPAQSKGHAGWIFFVAAGLLIILAAVAAAILWQYYQPEAPPVVAERSPTEGTPGQATAQTPDEAGLPIQAEARESLTVSAPPERDANKSAKETSRNQSPRQPAEDSATRSAAPATEIPPPSEETAAKDNQPQPAQPETEVESRPPEIVRRSRGVVHGSVVRRVEPAYPREALRHGIKGKVVVEVIIDENGNVISATIMSGPEPLRSAALRAARLWRFGPTLLNGVPSKSSRTIEFNFVRDK